MVVCFTVVVVGVSTVLERDPGWPEVAVDKAGA